MGHLVGTSWRFCLLARYIVLAFGLRASPIMNRSGSHSLPVRSLLTHKYSRVVRGPWQWLYIVLQPGAVITPHTVGLLMFTCEILKIEGKDGDVAQSFCCSSCSEASERWR